MQQLDQQLIDRGISANRYGLVGFGGFDGGVPRTFPEGREPYRLRVFGPGNELLADIDSASATVLPNFELPRDGDYTVVLEALGSSDVDVSAIIDRPGLEAFDSVGLNQDIAFAIESGSQATYTFSAATGTLIAIDTLPASASSGSFDLLSPSGVSVLTNGRVGDLPSQIVLPESGEYTLALKNTGTVTLETSLNVADLYSVAAQISSDASESPIQGGIEPGRLQAFTFEGEVGTSVFFDGLSSSDASQVRARLIRPDGTTVWSNQRLDQDRDPVLLDQAGMYLLVLEQTSDTRSSVDFAFRVINLETTPIRAIGESIALDNTEAPSATPYRISLSESQRVTLQLSQADSRRQSIAVLDPFGNEVAASSSSSSSLQNLVFDAQHSGIYCLLYTSPSPRDLSTSRMPSSA